MSRNNVVQGVSWDKERNNYRVYGVRQNGKISYLGRYKDYDIAVAVRKKYEDEHLELFPENS